MTTARDRLVTGPCVRPPQLAPLALAILLAACNGSDDPAPDPAPGPPSAIPPVGGLAQSTLRGPITHTTAEGWRLRIEGGTVTIRPPEAETGEHLQYSSYRMREQLGTHDLRAWQGDRRSLLLPGGAKITMHGQGGEILRLSIFDGAESHEVDVLTQTIMHSHVDLAVAQMRDAAEADGETGHLATFPLLSANSVFRLHLANLYRQEADIDGSPLRTGKAVQVLGRQVDTDLHLQVLPPAPAPEADGLCQTNGTAFGRLVRMPDNSLDYTTASGKWLVKVHGSTITVSSSMYRTYEFWGDGHENLNGKHLKDWFGERRTLLLDDGAKITLHAYAADQPVHTTHIIDGAQSHEIGNQGTVVRHSCVNAQVAMARDLEEADGETAYLSHLRSPASNEGYVHVENVYTEAATPEGVAAPEFSALQLGETGEADINPKQIHDFYDDPRIGHT